MKCRKKLQISVNNREREREKKAMHGSIGEGIRVISMRQTIYGPMR